MIKCGAEQITYAVMTGVAREMEKKSKEYVQGRNQNHVSYIETCRYSLEQLGYWILRDL